MVGKIPVKILSFEQTFEIDDAMLVMVHPFYVANLRRNPEYISNIGRLFREFPGHGMLLERKIPGEEDALGEETVLEKTLNLLLNGRRHEIFIPNRTIVMTHDGQNIPYENDPKRDEIDFSEFTSLVEKHSPGSIVYAGGYFWDKPKIGGCLGSTIEEINKEYTPRDNYLVDNCVYNEFRHVLRDCHALT